jgi:zinc protease
MPRLLFGSALGLAFLSAASASAAALPFSMTVETLDNGLRLVTIPYASPGLIAYWEVVRTGSRDEVEKGVTGFAHFFEHMMFRGTKEYPPEKVSAYLKKTGADQNGFTTDDFTCYTFFGRSDALEELVKMEADRFANLDYTEDAFKTESKAVLGEYNKSASSPFTPLNERLRELVFKKHTYGHTVIGYLKDIESMPTQYAYSRTFFKRFYRPDNLTILAVGDFDRAKLLAYVKQYYGPWTGKRDKTKAEAEPPQKKEVTGQIAWKSPTLPYLSISWRTPQTKYDSPETAAYNVLYELLFGKTSKLYSELVLEKQTVDSFDDVTWNHRDAYLFHTLVKVKDNAQVKAVEQRIDKAVEELAKGKLDPKDLDDVKSNVRYGLLLSLDTPDKIANTLAYALAPTGEIDGLEKMLGALEKLTVKDVQAFAKKYLTKANESVIILEHEEGAK